MYNECCFCDKGDSESGRFSENRKIGLPCEDSIIYEDDNIFITPDIAPLVVGHFLIITKTHYSSFASVDDKTYKSLERAKNYLKNTVFTDEKLLFFEHGAVTEHSAGACIDHAHIHAMPLNEDIDIDDLINKFGFISSDKIRATRESLALCAVNKKPYIFYDTNDNGQWYYPVDALPKQFFRRIIAFHFSKAYAWGKQCKRADSKECFMKTLDLARKNNKGKQLHELGEDNVVSNIIYKVFPYLQETRDDATVIESHGSCQLVVSTDPCPEPVVTYFDIANKYYHYGRMSVLINYSDLAAMGAKPVGILLSTVMENDMLEGDYLQFQIGVKEACGDWGGELLNGNVKDGNSFSVNGTSIGVIENGSSPLKRKGAQANDVICTVGDLGMFWLAVLKLKENSIMLSQLDEYTKSFIANPSPKIKEGLILSRFNFVTACMDSSDGIVGCLYELAELNNLSMQIYDNELRPNQLLEKFCSKNDYDHRNLMLSWGGWELIFTCRPDKIDMLRKVFHENSCDFNVIGQVIPKESNAVTLIKDDKKYFIQDFSSKRFSKNSYFSHGLEAYIEQLKCTHILPVK